MFRHRYCRLLFCVRDRLPNGRGRCVGLRGTGDIYGRLGQRQLRLRQAHKFGYLHRCRSQNRRHRVGVAHVLGRTNRNPTRDKTRILAARYHPGKPVNRSIGVTASHTLLQRACQIIVRITCAVVTDCLLLYRLFCDFQIKFYLTLILMRSLRQHANLQSRQGLSSVAVAGHRQKLQRLLIDPNIIFSQPPFAIANRLLQ